MIELIILTALQKSKSTIYGIKEEINRLFVPFLKVSFGALHPILKKLEKEKYLSVKEIRSSGGKKSSVYSLTKEGKDYFNTLMIEDLPENPASGDKLINIKLIALDFADETSHKAVLDKMTNYLELLKIRIENDLKSEETQDGQYRKKTLRFSIDEINAKIEFIKSLR